MLAFFLRGLRTKPYKILPLDLVFLWLTEWAMVHFYFLVFIVDCTRANIITKGFGASINSVIMQETITCLWFLPFWIERVLMNVSKYRRKQWFLSYYPSPMHSCCHRMAFPLYKCYPPSASISKFAVLWAVWTCVVLTRKTEVDLPCGHICILSLQQWETPNELQLLTASGHAAPFQLSTESNFLSIRPLCSPHLYPLW